MVDVEILVDIPGAGIYPPLAALGLGKSVLTSRIIQSLRLHPDITTIFYLCNSHTDQSDLCSHILRILILEILRAHPLLTGHVFENYIRQGRTSSLVQIRKLLPELLLAVSSIRIVIDGLDECQEKDQKTILSELLSIVKVSVIPCKLLISSRAETYLSRTLRKSPSISLSDKMERRSVDKDIQIYVTHALKELRGSFPSDVVNEVEKTVVKKANGMFLWVRLVIAELLDRESAYELQKAAHNLPQGLHKASQKAITILQWMACAFRPLKTFEIQDGLVFESADSVLNDETKPTKSLLELCKPLIEVGFEDSVDFVHFSAKDRNSEEEQVLRVVKGFHGLHTYANEFLAQHTLRYAELQYRCNAPFSETLIVLLSRLLCLRKKNMPITFISASRELKAVPDIEQRLAQTNLPPSLRSFMRDMLIFKEISNQDNHHHTDPKANRD
ncbi:hypothetical protein CJF32_00003614 [Rutstroemia sp. NJR-2017a WRK4]|nr:hypothetical protein CJF32_00003614 [Rutstroemia sp. NJR-2017a WRK4]